jgi:hypothetical protein
MRTFVKILAPEARRTGGAADSPGDNIPPGSSPGTTRRRPDAAVRLSDAGQAGEQVSSCHVVFDRGSLLLGL